MTDAARVEGGDVTDEGGMSDLDAVTQLDSLERAEAIWSSKLKEQQTIDSFQTVKGWSHGSRSKALTKRLAGYHNETVPILKHYTPNGIVKSVNANQGMEGVWAGV